MDAELRLTLDLQAKTAMHYHILLLLYYNYSFASFHGDCARTQTKITLSHTQIVSYILNV